MTDFGAYRAMLLDFGVDPRAVDTMSWAELASMERGLLKRRGKAPAPSKEVEAAAFEAFTQAVANDPSVRLH